MKTYRLLDPDTDQDTLQEILSDFLAYEKSINSRNYPYEQMEKKCSFYQRAFKKENFENFAISGEFTDNKITGVAVGYTFQVAWNAPTNPLSSWVLGLTYTKEMSSGNPNKKLNEITDALSDHFEKLYFNSFYIVARISNKINKENWNRYRARSISPYATHRYVPYVEKLIISQEDIDNCKFTNLRTIIHPTYQRNLVILQLVLNNNLRHK
jgi:hypothetical protein